MLPLVATGALKNESACTFLVSYLNVGKRVASSNDNFIIFGANCEESCPVVKKYVQLLCQEITNLEGKVFEIEGLKFTFKFEEVPNDMKMLAMLGGRVIKQCQVLFLVCKCIKRKLFRFKGYICN